MIIFRGCKYTKHRINRRGITRWRCYAYNNKKCNARLFTIGDDQEIIKCNDMHTHPLTAWNTFV